MSGMQKTLKILCVVLPLLMLAQTSQAGLATALSKLFREMFESAPAPRTIPDSAPTPREVPPAPRDAEGIQLGDDISRSIDEAGDPSLREIQGERLHRETLQGIGRNIDANFKLRTPARNPHLLVAMPTNSGQYRRVYGRDVVSAGAERELKKFSDQLSQVEGAENMEGGLESLRAAIDSSEGGPVVVFAHSEEGGRKLILGNGEEVLDKEIHQYCADRGKVCVVLTCNGDDFALKDKVSALDGLAMWRRAELTMAAREKHGLSLSKGEFILAMRRQKSQLERERKARVGLSFSGAVGGVVYYYSSEDRGAS